jgi:hypothetical protein
MTFPNPLKAGHSLLCIALLQLFGSFQQQPHTPKTDEEIIRKINAHRPLLGATIPKSIRSRLGASHVDGKYFLTQQPFITEGAQQMEDMGLGVAKLFFTKGLNGYHFNSDWKLSAHSMTLKELAQHPYYKACFEKSFSTIILLIDGAALGTTEATAAQEEGEIYELTKYLLTSYKDRNITFVLQNWEGDWLFRSGTGPNAQWSLSPQPGVTVNIPSDVAERKD